MITEENEKFTYRLWRYEGEHGELIPLLQSAQDHFGYIPRHAIRSISSVLNLPESQIYGVITFYSQFRLTPMGKNVIKLCVGTACHVSGSRLLVSALEDMLGIEEGETTPDGLFSLFTVACLGCCSLAPVMMINDQTYGKLTASSMRKIIRKIQLDAKNKPDGR